MNDPYDLDRFVRAQDLEASYERACEELRCGHKTGHWMWFIFPQIAGLGQSPTSKQYAISSLEEAKAYLMHPILGPRLLECANGIAATENRSAPQILGDVDAQKLRSSMTLFLKAAPECVVFMQVLNRYFSGIPDPLTEELT
jgi:uncharacterized protein (DUF1810 family)